MREVLAGLTALERAAKRGCRRSTPYEVKCRLAYVGTVAFVGSDQRELRTLCYRASADDGPEELLARKICHVRPAPAQRPNRRTSVIQGVVREMWRLAVCALKAEPCVRFWDELTQYHNAFERSAAIAAAMDSDTSANRAESKRAFREDHDAVDRVREEVALKIAEAYAPRRRFTLEEELVCLNNNQEGCTTPTCATRPCPLGLAPPKALASGSPPFAADELARAGGRPGAVPCLPIAPRPSISLSLAP